MGIDFIRVEVLVLGGDDIEVDLVDDFDNFFVEVSIMGDLVVSVNIKQIIDYVILLRIY